jgi:hypothetical protein
VPPKDYALTPVSGNPFVTLTPVDHDPFGSDAYAMARRPVIPPTQPAFGQAGAAPLDDFQPAPVQSSALQPAIPGLADVAGDPSRSMALRVPAAIGSALADQGLGLARSVWGAATLPGDVATGKVDPNSLEAVRRSSDLAGMLTLPAVGGEASPSIARVGLTPVDHDPFAGESAITAYHGSPKEFDEFEVDEDDPLTHWFTTDDKTAAAFGRDKANLPPHSNTKVNISQVRIGGSIKTVDPLADAQQIYKDNDLGTEEDSPKTWDEAAHMLPWGDYQKQIINDARNDGFQAVKFVDVGDSPNKMISDHIAVIDPSVISIVRRYKK